MPLENRQLFLSISNLSLYKFLKTHTTGSRVLYVVNAVFGASFFVNSSKCTN